MPPSRLSLLSRALRTFDKKERREKSIVDCDKSTIKPPSYEIERLEGELREAKAREEALKGVLAMLKP